MCGGAAACLGFAAAIRCWGAHRRPARHRGAARNRAGPGLLDVDTDITGEKPLAEVSGETIADGAPVKGYEMHMGGTTGPATAMPLVRFSDGRVDGAISADGRVAGTYVHGFFADDRQRARGSRGSAARRRPQLRGGH